MARRRPRWPADGVRARVVSFPCWDRFERQAEDYRGRRLPAGRARCSASRPASTFGWDRYADDAIGIDHFGASAPGAVVMEKFGFTAEHVVERARALLAARWLTRTRRTAAASGRSTKGAVPMTRLQDLYDIAGQSPWLDNLRRDWLEDGQLAELLDLGVRGITSNPTIFAKAISGQDTYDDQFRALMKDHTVEGAYWEMAITDIKDALEHAAPALRRERRRGRLRLPRGVARAGPRHRGHGARRPGSCTTRIAQPNLFVKVPATREGVPAIETLIGEGRSINVTLIFGLDRYDEVMEAYLQRPRGAGRRRPARPSCPRWPAWPPSSSAGSTPRWTAASRPWPAGRRVTPPCSACGAPPRWPRPRWPTSTSTAPSPASAGRRCAAKGARVQRPLWASTSTKNPAYSDLLYVDNLIGPATVNTMPEGTLRAFEDHGTLKRTVDADPDGAAAVLDRLRRGRDRHGGRGADARGRGRALLRQVLRRAAAVADRQSRYLLIRARQHNREERA